MAVHNGTMTDSRISWFSTSQSVVAASIASRRALLAGAGVATVALLAACTSEEGSDDATPYTDEPRSEPAAGAGDSFDESRPYLVFGSNNHGPVVELFVDYRCPHCKVFAEVNGRDLEQLVNAGTIELHVFPRPMLDPRTGTTFSMDTANAVVAAYVQDPALYFEVESAMFELQPASPQDPTPGTADIAAAAAAQGVSDEGVAAIESSEYAAWVTTVEQVGQEREIGTPTVYVNGQMFEGDFTVPGELLQAIEAAAADQS